MFTRSIDPPGGMYACVDILAVRTNWFHNCLLAAGVTCPFMQGYESFAGYDHYGDDITKMSGATLQALAAACNISPTCYAFNWSPNPLLPFGYLKTTAASPNIAAGYCLYKWTSG